MWQEPKEPNGLIVLYEVSYRRYGDEVRLLMLGPVPPSCHWDLLPLLKPGPGTSPIRCVVMRTQSLRFTTFQGDGSEVPIYKLIYFLFPTLLLTFQPRPTR